jgi:anaerobic selenocysteine-containing dehydrogenase
MAKSGTGPDMGPHANVAEHLLQALNVVCGRFPRAGDRYAGSGVLSGTRSLRAQPLPPMRSWEQGFRSRLGVGTLRGELPSPLLPDEILEPGPDRVRALVVSGGNPATAFPDQDRIVEALRALDLLVTVDPFPSETARLAHYVIAPTMQLERADDTRAYEYFYSDPFAQYTAPLLDAPGDVIEDWAFFYELSARMGLLLNIGDRVWEAGTPRPTADELLESLAQRAQVPYADIRAEVHGATFDAVDPTVVGPPADGATARFDIFPPDVAAEYDDARRALARPLPRERPYRLVVRRARATLNSLGRRTPHEHTNPCFAHPDDLAAIGVREGDLVRLGSEHGCITAVAGADATLRRGVLSMTHAFGRLPEDADEPRRYGANPTRLLSLTDHRQAVSLMPWMTAIPVSATAVGDDSDDGGVASPDG